MRRAAAINVASAGKQQQFKGRNANYLISMLLNKIAKYGVLPSVGKNIIAYSGGIDSTVTAALVYRMFPQNTIAVTGISSSLSQTQLDQARDVAKFIGVKHVETETNEGEKEGYIKNVGNACYYCKTTLYERLKQVQEYAIAETMDMKNNNDNNDNAIGRQPEVVLFNGTNSEDLLDDTRVGLIAAKEFSVFSPLENITKDEVRIVGQYLNLPNYNAAASPCLRSRLAFGIEATEEHLKAVELAEDKVRLQMKLLPEENMRVRLLPKHQAALEVHGDRLVDAQETLKIIQDDLEILGFTNIYARAFKSGSVSGYVKK